MFGYQQIYIKIFYQVKGGLQFGQAPLSEHYKPSRDPLPRKHFMWDLIR